MPAIKLVRSIPVFFLFTLFIFISSVNVAFAQCSVSSAPSFSCSCAYEFFTSISASGTGVTSTISFSGTSCSGTTYYNDYSTQGVTATTGSTVNMTVARALSSYTGTLYVFIDWNNDGTYETTEMVGSAVSYSPGVSTHTYSFTVPTSGVAIGTHLHMRVFISELSSSCSSGTTSAPCTGTYGEAAEFYFQANCSSVPSITTSPASGSICSGGSGLSVTASGAGTGGAYTWSPATGLSATTGATVTATPTVTTVYTITGTTSAGCSNYAVVPVTVNATPSSITGTTGVCVGATTTLTDASSGGAWSSGSSGATVGSTGTVTGVSAGSVVISYTIAGCSATTTVTVHPTPSVTGTLNVCVGSTTPLSGTSTGGTWTSSNSNATVGSGSGIVTGVAAGTSIITYTLSTGCIATVTITINSLPSSVTGTMNVCAGSTTTLSSPPGTGTWTSSNSNATVGSGSGIVTGVTAGTSVITYTITNGCFSIATVTIENAPASITGTLNVCIGSTTTVSSSPGTGTWSSSNSNATVGSGTGIVTGITAGTSIITYMLGTGCYKTVMITVNPLPSLIAGTMNVCAGATRTLSDTVTGGAWSSSNSNAAIGSGSGIVTGVTSGASVITYTLGPGCFATTSITINPAPSSIAGVTEVCVGSATTMYDAGGTWSISNSNAAIGSSSGIVTGVTSGASIISYTLGTGCFTTYVITVDPLPSIITGTMNVCVGLSRTLSDTATGGTWSSSNTNAAIGSATGIVTGATAGTSVITYTLPTGCMITTSVTVNPLPSSITGTMNVCVGLITTLSNASTPGTWSSSNANATIGSGSGTVTGVTAGTSIITYTSGTGCFITTTITVNPLPSLITGTMNVCVGLTRTLSDASSPGAWSSSNANATVGSGSGTITGVTAGTSIITYTLGTGCITTATVTVDPLASLITGTMNVCAGLTRTLSDTATGGTWSSSNTNVSIGSGTGIAMGVTAGTSVITYTLATGCIMTGTVTVNPLPYPITGTMNVCVGSTATLTDTSSGGSWSISNTHATIGATSGVLTGITAGLSIVTYTLGTGCIETTVVTINSLPSSITGTTNVCVGLTTTLSDISTGGSWSSSNSNATIGSGSGTVTGNTAGTSIITYTLSTGCIAETTVTVDPLPSSITGTMNVCVGSATTLGDISTGGVWSSSNTNAAIGSSGTVTGVSAGTSVITYTLGTGCMTVTTITVNPLPSSITGTMNVCVGLMTTLSDVSTLGAWSSSNTNASIGSGSGNVTGVTAGTSIISYSFGTGCYVTVTMTIDPLPLSITGATVVCEGSTATLSDLSTGGGIWSSSNTNASIGSGSGVVTGVTTGISFITYTLGTGCITTTLITVNALPSPISGTMNVCIGSATTLSDPGGGIWSSSNANATVGSATGIVSGDTAGTSIITYSLGTGCAVTATITVNPLPLSITGPDSVCADAAINLHELTSGGSWSSSNSNVSVGSGSGSVTGITAGASVITYLLGTGCYTTTLITINPLPLPISGTYSVCQGSATLLWDGTTGGIWSSSNANAAIDPGTGIVTGITGGTSIITYLLGTGCFAISPVTIDPLPSIISGDTIVCAGSTTHLTDAGGGAWSSSDTTIASIDPGTGIVTGITAGVMVITYTLPTGCFTTTNLTVNPLPPAISGVTRICMGLAVTLSDAGGGTWGSSNPAVAAVGLLTGDVTSVGTGISTITYTLGTGCLTTAGVTVSPVPSVVTGTNEICAGYAVHFSDSVSGGVWSSSNAAIASVGSVSGIISGISGGSAAIIYSLATGCTASKTITVNSLPSAIAGGSSVCIGSTTDLTDSVAGGTWSSSNAYATIGSGSGIVTGVSAGTSVITYTLPTGCFNTITVTVISLPSPISGAASVCAGAATTLTDPGGGAWSSSNADVSIGSLSGIVTGITAGISVITYMVGTGCMVTASMTVNPSPGPITGITIICQGLTTLLSDTTSGGAWSSGSTHATAGSGTGLVTGVSAGTSIITYAFPAGCRAITTISVNPLPAAITGTFSICSGSATLLGDITGTGTWISGNTTVATIDSVTGLATGVSGGTSIISYSLGTGCMVTRMFTVNPSPAITGATGLCIGSAITLSNTFGGGTWSSSNPLVAAISPVSGTVTGISVGTSVITYALSSGCQATITVTVNSSPPPVSGSAAVCIGSGISLTDAGSGIWSSSDTAIATVGSGTGFVTGIASGVVTISFSIGTGCTAVKPVTVNPLPAAISGTGSVCVGSAALFGDTMPGGVWSISSTLVATVGSGTGVVIGMSTGLAVLTYETATGCMANKIVTINPIPTAITGIAVVCQGATTTLNDTSTGGIWSCAGTAISVSGGGIVTGIVTGVAAVTYTLGTGCRTTYTVTVQPLPAPISGASGICFGSTAVLSDVSTPGTWSSSNASVAPVSSVTGVVTAASDGIAVITYTNSSGCFITKTITIDPLPPAIIGAPHECVGTAEFLSDPVSGGTWSSGSPAIAGIGSASGMVTGLSAGTAIITYTSHIGCSVSTAFTVFPVPSAISGPASVCEGGVAALMDTLTGGVWSSNDTSLATVSPYAGVVTGIVSGAIIISYTIPATGCLAVKPMTINPAASILGNPVVCMGYPAMFTDTIPGGSWRISDTLIAAISATGMLNGVSTGTAIVTYTFPSGCTSIKTVTVNPSPDTISGLTRICIGGSTTLSDLTFGGVWSSPGSAGIVTIGSAGVVTGVGAGTANVSYSIAPAGCPAIIRVTVIPLPGPVSGSPNVCLGIPDTLTDHPVGGVWSSSNLLVTTIGSATGVVSGVVPGTAIIDYSLGPTCTVYLTVTVHPAPSAISGPTYVCEGRTAVLSDPATGGTWSSSNAAIETISTTGVVTGITGGIANITYMVPIGPGISCPAIYAVAVDTVPPIIDAGNICAYGTTLHVSDSAPGGAWTSALVSITPAGIVTSYAAGAATIYYTLPSGCYATATLTVNPLPDPITVTAGTIHTCAGTALSLSELTTGGVWSSSTTAVATVGTSGHITTGIAGTATISYTLPTGCAQQVTVTVDAFPSSGVITGTMDVCVGAAITLTNTATGGTWSAANATAIIGSAGALSGIVTGVSAGTDTIRYAVTNTCGTATSVKTITINPLPNAGTVTGADSVCTGATIILSPTHTGGAWSAVNATASVISGLVTGVSTGSDTIIYSITNSCGTASTTFTIAVLTLPMEGTITGLQTVCIGLADTLTGVPAGGAWSSTNANASVGSGALSAIITGISAGLDTVGYGFTNSCGSVTASYPVTVISCDSISRVNTPVIFSKGNIILVPNPAREEITIENLPAGGCKVNIYDVAGKEISLGALKVSGDNIVVDIANLVSGIYEVEITDAFGMKMVRRLVKE